METGHKDTHRSLSNKIRSDVNNFSDDFLNLLISEKFDSATEFLQNFLEAKLLESSYPIGIGAELYDALVATPQDIRGKIQFPLFPTNVYGRLFSVASEQDRSDLRLLFIINSGQSIRTLPTNKLHRDQPIENRLEIILRKIDAINLTKKIALPIDAARGSYALESATANLDEFEEVLVSFYSHLLSSLNRKISDSGNDALGAEAYDLLGRAYANQGGIKAAMLNVADGANGGLRHVFDAMVEQLKSEEKEAYVNYVLKTGIDPLDWDGKVNLMDSFLEKLGDNLPEEITRNHPERYVSNWEIIVKAYVRSIDQVKSILKLF